MFVIDQKVRQQVRKSQKFLRREPAATLRGIKKYLTILSGKYRDTGILP